MKWPDLKNIDWANIDLKKLKLAKLHSFFSSIKLTVFCLFWLTVLTFWGTLYQKTHSLYDATNTFFDSWFLVFGAYDAKEGMLWTPLPGGMLIMALLFINLLTSFFAHYRAGFRMPGLMVTHLGLVMLLVGGLATRLFNVEARVDLYEGDKTNIAFSLTDWELSMWSNPDIGREVHAIDLKHLKEGKELTVEQNGLTFRVQKNFRNADVQVEDDGTSGALIPKKPAFNVTENFPALVLGMDGLEGGADSVVLSALDMRPRIVTNAKGEKWMLQVRRKRYQLPVMIELDRFSTQQFPSSSIPVFYRSDVTVHFNEDSKRPGVVEMNHPLRVAGWTFFQTSFSNRGNVTQSSFTATRNVGRLIPYWATFVTAAGLFAHFIQVLFMQVMRDKRRKGAMA